MNRSIIRGFTAAVFVAVLVGCDKKETASKQEDGAKAKQDENIVNLTKANLELVTIKTEPALKGARVDVKSRGSCKRQPQQDGEGREHARRPAHQTQF